MLRTLQCSWGRCGPIDHIVFPFFWLQLPCLLSWGCIPPHAPILGAVGLISSLAILARLDKLENRVDILEEENRALKEDWNNVEKVKVVESGAQDGASKLHAA